MRCLRCRARDSAVIGAIAVLLTLFGLAVVPLAQAKPTLLLPPKKLRPAPSCAIFAGAFSRLAIGPIGSPRILKLGHTSTCTWKGQAGGHYGFILTAAVAPDRRTIGEDLLDAARASAGKAARTTGGFGEFIGGNPRRGRYFNGMAYWDEESQNESTEACSTDDEGIEDNAIKIGQSSPECRGQPGTEGSFATAYGSPHANIEPLLVQLGAATQINEVGALKLAGIVRAMFVTGR